ncbi:MAG TPA: hypothetical protein VD793_01750 [Gemmatimonadales bacterium]|nr:hypothetical protein [Gemmatimonadales bacterium]
MPYPGDTTRSSGGFSLDDAGRLYRRSQSGVITSCPNCGTAMRSVVSEVGRDRLHLLRCEICGRSVVLERQEGASGLS